MNRVVTTVLMAVVLLLPCVLQAENTYRHLYVFGDSLSDNGNVIALSPNLPAEFTLPAPYFGNRISNGLLAVEHLASLMGLPLEPFHANPATGTNFAVSGARARGTSPIDLTSQVDAFLSVKEGAVPDDALYVMFIGGNDLRDIRNEFMDGNRYSMAVIYRETLNAIGANVSRLIASGAKNLLVVTVPDISQIPETRKLESKNPKVMRMTSRVVTRFNRHLQRQVRHLRREHDDDNNSGIKLAVFDLWAYEKIILKHPETYGFQVNQQGCVNIDYTTFGITDINASCGANVEFIRQHYYFDEIHPSAYSHELMGRGLYSVIPSP